MGLVDTGGARAPTREPAWPPSSASCAIASTPRAPWARTAVTLLDPDTTYIDADVSIGPDTVIRPFDLPRGATTIGAGCALASTVQPV